MDDSKLCEVIARFRAAGVVELEFDAKERLRRLVLRPDYAPQAGTLFEAPSIATGEPLPTPASRRPTALHSIVSDGAIPDIVDDGSD